MLFYRTHLPSDLEDDQPWLVLLHGRGAHEEDMLELSEFFPEYLIITPRAPFSARDWGYGPGYAWYRFLGGTIPDPDDFEQAQQALAELLDYLRSNLGVKPGPLFLGGFSQGGTMSLGYALRHPGSVGTVLNLSGFLADHPSVRVTPETVADTCFYWPHGLHDTAVPHALVQQGRSQLLAAGAQLAAPDYPMGHTIMIEEIDDIRELLRKL